MSARILVIEDDADLRRGVCFNLRREGHEVSAVGDGVAARAALQGGSTDLVLLDLNLPDVDGLELLKEIRAASSLPVICLTARGQETDVVMGLQLGADDYVAKPFGVAELLARVAAVLRRGPPTACAGESVGAARVDLVQHRVELAGRTAELTPIECELLRYLLERRGQVVRREQLLKDLWGLSRKNDSRTLDNHIARLRRKIEADPATPRALLTVHGVGYRLLAR